MKKIMITEGIASLFILLFLYTSLTKLFDFHEFRYQIGYSPLLKPIAGIIAIGLPLIEIMVSLMFFIKRTRLLAFYGSCLLMAAFTGYIIWMLSSGLDLPCTCGGFISAMTWKQHLLFNIFFVLLAGVGIFFQRKISKIDFHRKEIGFT